MPYSMELPPEFAAAGWTVKIYEKEARESPHLTLRRRGQVWRLDLRHRTFLDRDPPSRSIPGGLLAHLFSRWPEPCQAWDRLHPDNPVLSPEDP